MSTLPARHARAPQGMLRLRLLHRLHWASLLVLLVCTLLLVGLRVYPSPWLFPSVPAHHPFG